MSDIEPNTPEGLLIDPDCRSDKCGSCAGDPCEHSCHTTQAGEDGDEDIQGTPV